MRSISRWTWRTRVVGAAMPEVVDLLVSEDDEQIAERIRRVGARFEIVDFGRQSAPNACRNAMRVLRAAASFPVDSRVQAVALDVEGNLRLRKAAAAPSCPRA